MITKNLSENNLQSPWSLYIENHPMPLIGGFLLLNLRWQNGIYIPRQEDFSSWFSNTLAWSFQIVFRNNVREIRHPNTQVPLSLFLGLRYLNPFEGPADLFPFPLSDLVLITKQILQADHTCKNTGEIKDHTFKQVNCVHFSRIRILAFTWPAIKIGETSGQCCGVNTFHSHTSFLSLSCKDLAVTFTFMSLKAL